MPLDRRVGTVYLQSCADAVPLDRSACQRGLRRLSRQRTVCGNADRVLVLPPVRLSADNESQSRRWAVQSSVSVMPHHEWLVTGELQSQPYGLSAIRSARISYLYAMPHQRAVQQHAHRLLVMPSAGLQQRRGSKSYRQSAPARLPGMSQYSRVGTLYVQSQ